MNVVQNAPNCGAAELPASGSEAVRPSQAPDIFHLFTSGTEQVRAALVHVQDAMVTAGADQSTCDTLQIILGEVLNNVVEHAYRFEETHAIELSVWLQNTGPLCKICDQGVPMPNGVPPAGVSLEINARTREDLPEGGFGWAMVRELTEDLQYFRVDGRNELVFRIPKTDPLS